MRVVLSALLGLQLLGLDTALATEGKFLVELNTIEPVESRCRLNFVIENKSDAAVDSMKLDLVVFGSDGGILQRLLTEMGPVRSLKTIVRAFVIDVECSKVGSVLVNGKVVRGKQKSVHDGSYAEAKDIVNGFTLIEAKDLPHAVELSKGCPILEVGGSVEVRPIRILDM